jgi:outer membrane protein TolC
MDSTFGRTSDPVGNTLVTGGPSRLREATWKNSMGLRQVNRWGGRVDANQQFGALDNNSVFLAPPNQGNARLNLSLTQPLLNGAGRLYTERLIVTAQIDTQLAWQETYTGLQDHLVKVYTAYWTLYQLRANWLQRRGLAARGHAILDVLEARQELDVGNSQLIRARAAVARRDTQLIRTAALVRDAQAQLRALVGSPTLVKQPGSELIPRDGPALVESSIDADEAVRTGLTFRPEIGVAMRNIDRAALELQIARRDLLPALNAIVDTYVAGLRGNRNIGNAWTDQFANGEPGYSAGLELNVPLYNRAAKARQSRSQQIYRQRMRELEEQLLNVGVEIEIAARDVTTTRQETTANLAVLQAALLDEQQIGQRWEILAGDDRAGSLLLEDWLEAQERRTQAESDVVGSQVQHVLALAKLERAMGTLLDAESIEPSRASIDGLPTIEFTGTPSPNPFDEQPASP